MNAVIGFCHPDFVNWFGAAVDHLPLAARNVKQYPDVAESAYLRPAQDKRFFWRVGKDRSGAESSKRAAAIGACRHADGDIKRHRFASRPSSVICAHLVTMPDNRDWISSELIKCAQPTQGENRFICHADDAKQVGTIEVDICGIAYVLAALVGPRTTGKV